MTIKIPFDRCTIVSTLNFSQITDRLESAIYDPNFLSQSNSENIPKHQSYFGRIEGYKFSATRLVGHKYLHLPAFLFPTIEGNINSLHHGYEISLVVRIHNLTLALLLVWLGGLFTVIPSLLDNIFVGVKNYQYLTTVEIVPLVFAAIAAYFYLDAWRATKFFRTLFIKKFRTAINDRVVNLPIEPSGFQLQPEELSGSLSSTDLLRKNLPSFPDRKL
jgi:hypothetical protein